MPAAAVVEAQAAGHVLNLRGHSNFTTGEVARVLGGFIADFPNLHQCIAGRRAVVCMISE